MSECHWGWLHLRLPANSRLVWFCPYSITATHCYCTHTHIHTIFVSRFDLDKRYNESDKNTSCTPTMSTIVSICVLHFIGSFYKCCSVCALVSSKSCVHCPIAHWTIPINLITYLSGNEVFNSNKKSNECVQVRLQKDTNVEYGYRMCAKEWSTCL